MNISYEYYRIFYYVAKYHNLTLAAQVLHNNQPNISRTIKLLEHELGCTLLQRSNRGISLTPEGEQLFSHVKIAVEELQAAEDKLSRSAGLQEGTVTIGASETALHMLLLPALNAFKKQYPGVHICIRNHLTVQAMDSVKSGLVDFALVVTSSAVNKPLHAIPILTFRDILVGGSDYAHLADAPCSLCELSRCPLICLGEHTTTYHLYEWFYRSLQLSFCPELEAATADQILPMIKNNLGIGFLPEIYAREALKKKEVFLIPIEEQLPLRKICLIENERYPLSRAARELKKYCCRIDDTTATSHW